MAHHPNVMEIWPEQGIILPHVKSLQAKLKIYLVAQSNAHNLIEIISCRLRRRNWIYIKHSDIWRGIPRSNQMQRGRRAHRAAASDNDDLRACSWLRHGILSDDNRSTFILDNLARIKLARLNRGDDEFVPILEDENNRNDQSDRKFPI